MTPDAAALRARLAEFTERLNKFFAWHESPEFQPCPRCQGRGSHHGFGEHGHDPDWCELCGGPGEQPTEPGTWAPEDLLAEARALLDALVPALVAAPPPHGNRRCECGHDFAWHAPIGECIGENCDCLGFTVAPDAPPQHER